MGLGFDKSKEGSKKEKKDLGRLADGTYVAKVCQIIDLGRQYIRDWQTDEIMKWDDGNPQIKEKVWITFEFPSETIELTDAEDNTETVSRILGKEYLKSTHEKAALTGLIQAVNKDANGFTDLMGKYCLVTVGSTSGGKAKVVGLAPLMAGIDTPEGICDELVFDMDNPDESVMDKLPKFIQEEIRKSHDWVEPEADKEEDVPF
jgi:hypothetical protein